MSKEQRDLVADFSYRNHNEEKEFDVVMEVEDMFKDFPEDKLDEMFKEDMVNKPPHYNRGGVECIDAIMAATKHQNEGYLQGNVMKYVWRYPYKGGLEDLLKCRWYLDKLIEEYKKKHK